MSPHIAVIGSGPRALGALEALARADIAAHVDLFDPHPYPAAGPNFSPDQSALCLLNVPLHAIDLPPSPVPGIPDLAGWLGCHDPERYPQRAELGGYLMARLAALIGSGPLQVALRAERVAAITPAAQGWVLAGRTYDQVLLTPGQPATRPDPQLAEWQSHAKASDGVLVAAYPDTRLLRMAGNWAGRQVAIRGLGLSTLDVLSLMTEGLGGRFDGHAYYPSGREPARLLPFSLTGLAPFPKPGAALDAALSPLPAETQAFEAALAEALTLPPDPALERICAAIAPAAARLSGQSPADWLRAERRDPGSQHRDGPIATLRHVIAMAEGRAAPDVGYVVGALWRKWQNALRRGFNPARLPDPTAAALVAWDEGLKRYSYGPPLVSARRLLTLIETGLVDLRATDDPDIRTTPAGWTLVEGDSRIEAGVMIDAVLPSPDLDRLCDPLFADLRRQGLIETAGDGLGARLAPDGRLIGTAGPVAGLCLLGRMGLGSVIAVDSIHDCFGAAAERWAAGVAQAL